VESRKLPEEKPKLIKMKKRVENEKARQIKTRDSFTLQ
jgi:hypothetical protein